jgi:hypothetical protein
MIVAQRMICADDSTGGAAPTLEGLDPFCAEYLNPPCLVRHQPQSLQYSCPLVIATSPTFATITDTI